MTKRIVPTDRPAKQIRDIGLTAERIDPDFVARALGAKDTGIRQGDDGSPVSVLLARLAILKSIASDH